MARRVTDQPDDLVRGALEDPALRFSLARTTETVTTGILVHDTDPAAASLFGRCLTAAILLAPQLDGKEKYMIRWEYGEGSIGSILVDVDAEARVRGIPRRKHLSESAGTERDLYGPEGRVSVLRFEEGRILASGTAPARLLDVVDDLAFFFSTSDQVETEILAGLDFRPDPENPVAGAFGLLLQAMPGCDLSRFEEIRGRLRSPRIRELLRTGAHSGGLLRRLFAALLDRNEVPGLSFAAAPRPAYVCSCSAGKMKRALSLLSAEELRALAEQEGTPEITCEFCNTRYAFRPEDLS